MIRPWGALSGRFRARSVLIVGNGPGRIGHDSIVERFDGAVILCNSAWRSFRRPPDLLVSYDAARTAEIAGAGRVVAESLLLPEQIGPAVNARPADMAALRVVAGPVYEATPHNPGTQPGALRAPGWHPDRLAVGAFSGMLAFQAAMIGCADRLVLLGIDAAGTMDGDAVRLSAMPSDRPGYEHQRAPAVECRDLGGGALMPGVWADQLSMWRALTEVAIERGFEVTRAAPTGGLAWLGVEQWD